MFEYLESISITEGEQIKKTIQALFRQTCILQVKYDPATLVPKDNVQYEICVRHRHFMEWKGPLLYKLKGGQEYIEDKAREKEYEIDTSQNQYGTVINSQTLERAFPVSIKGVQRIVTIENKANYEEMKYREDTLYLFCHGFYSPKERIFLKRLMEVAEGEIQYFHWGDMDMGGIRIFRFNKKNIFPKLKPYKMDREAFQEALERGAGIPLEEKKKEKLEKLNAGELEELKKCILEKGVEIEQEILLAENAIAEN